MLYRLYITLLLSVLVLCAKAGGTYTENSRLASGRWVKIRVSDAGVYQITPAQLQEMGFSNPSGVQLFGYNVPVLPETNLHTFSDDLTEIPVYRRSDGTMLFYSCGNIRWARSSANATTFSHFVNPYSNHVYYFLTEGSPAALSTEQPSAEPTHTANTFPEHTLIDPDELSIMNSGRTFFEAYNYASGSTRAYSLPTPGIVSGSEMNIAIRFIAGGAATLQVSGNGASLGQLSFKAPGSNDYGTVSSSNLKLKNHTSGAANITLRFNQSGTASGHLDYIRGSYIRHLSISGLSHLAFRTLDKYDYKVTISGAQADTRVWKITSPKVTCEQTGALQGSNYVAKLTNSGMDEYVAVNVNSNFPAPEYIGQIENQNLHSLRNIDFVIIVPANNLYYKYAKQLADAHTAVENMRCIVVRADQIYNEFSSGAPDATAYRRFMKMLYDRADSPENAPKNLLLFGNCYWDNKFNTAALSHMSQDNCLLSYQSDNSWSHTRSYVSEEYYGLLDDNEGKRPLGEKPDIGIGRIPVTTQLQARNIVEKLISYIKNENTGAWKNIVCMMADDGNANIHMEDAETIIRNTSSKYPDFYYKRIYWDAYSRTTSTTSKNYVDVTNEINNIMQSGALIMNYTGHGSPYILSHEGVLKTEDFQKWSSPNLPLWITAACDVAPFDMNTKNIAVEALSNDGGAAVGFIGTSRTVFSSYNRAINKVLMQHLLERNSKGEHYTIGEALIQAKCDLIDQKSDTINKAHFVLLGDPAITLSYPTYKIKIDNIQGLDTNNGNVPCISAGQIVNVSGRIVDETGKKIDSFNGKISPKVFDSKVMVTCKNNDDSADTLFYFYDHNRTIYSGSATVNEGSFSFSFPVPLDINYSNESGLMNLYAVSNTTEAQGSFTDFTIGGTGNYKNDGVGPEITAWLNNEDFNDGDEVHESPWLFVRLTDSNGINVTGNGVGHDIMAIIDNEASTSYTLNNKFVQDDNNYTSGTIGFCIPELEEGEHTLTLRAFDIFNNVSTKEIHFTVVKGLEPEIYYIAVRNTDDSSKPIYDRATITVFNNRRGTDLDVNIWIYAPTGQLLHKETATGKERVNNKDAYTFKWDITSARGTLKAGAYIVRVGISTAEGKEKRMAKKFFVVGPERKEE